ncbi:hypothetical protein [Burkholderia multivorans]|uniref:hypothetical protein n=1 Tax=Burkholderia multivorans TaxID=87883 RepID=UPI001588851F|nr:hypothetical protein [Burkholderia multivorans]MDR8877252.1 hypothetical protein [Burkholderia multivorans]MDR8882488.1 hypothetical protein [Burkholderia multivorans]MDR8889451.1 hypothetical protein [Burkholderia multivorans]MDR8908205.1 hypothetical protein [Burkholderia multivorans]MDR8913913.1 hypothetical protein [Burkholderia multivorans]
MNQFDYASLSRDLDATIREIHRGPVEKEGLANYFKHKYERKYHEYFTNQDKARMGFHRGVALGGTASLASVGMIVASGSAVAPMAAGLALGGMGYMVAEAIRSVMLERRSRKEISRARDLIHAAAEEQLEVWAADNRGGFIGRLYSSVAARFKGYDERVRNIARELGKLDPSSSEYVQLVRHTIDEKIDPDFKQYLRRTSLEKHSPAALLTEQMKAGLQVRNEASVQRAAAAEFPLWDVPKYAGGAAGGVFAVAQAAQRSSERLDIRDLPNPPRSMSTPSMRR